MINNEHPKPQDEFDNSNERLEFCRKLMPKIIDSTDQFYDAVKPHPFLDALASGGYVFSHPELDTEEVEHLTIISASGFRDTFAPENFEKIGIPEDIAANGLMWVISRDEVEIEKDKKKSPAQRGSKRMDHSFAYWDGARWHVKRKKEEAHESDPWEEKWEDSELTAEEIRTISEVVTQTQDIQSIAEVFKGDHHSFYQTFIKALSDRSRITSDKLQTFAEYAVGSPFPLDTLPAYTRFFHTAYQSSTLLDTAYKLSSGNSRRLDSDGIVNARYYTSSLPFTSEMVQKGVNIPQSYIHPPVPFDLIEK